MSGRYSLWLVPEDGDPVADRLAALIADYAEGYDDAPEFDPHVTLGGGVRGDEEPIRTAVRNLAAAHDPVDLPVVKRHCSTTTTQSVFYLVEPTAALLDLHRNASDALDADIGMYVPHFSVIYADLPVAERRRLVEELPEDMVGSEVQGAALELVEIVGEVTDWNWPTVERYPL